MGVGVGLVLVLWKLVRQGCGLEVGHWMLLVLLLVMMGVHHWMPGGQHHRRWRHPW